MPKPLIQNLMKHLVATTREDTATMMTATTKVASCLPCIAVMVSEVDSSRVTKKWNARPKLSGSKRSKRYRVDKPSQYLPSSMLVLA